MTRSMLRFATPISREHARSGVADFIQHAANQFSGHSLPPNDAPNSFCEHEFDFAAADFFIEPHRSEKFLTLRRLQLDLSRQQAFSAVGIASSNRDFAFLAKQTKIILENCGVIDAEKIEEYIARDGYAALGKILTGLRLEHVIAEIKASGLRGRGGAGFPTGVKWEVMARVTVKPKYVICNADEGDPGAFMNRAVLEGDPHRVMEGMAIGGYAMGANRGFIYIRAEYPLAIQRLQIAIEQAYKNGLLGKNLFEKGFDFDLELRIGAGAFVCGEETALMRSIEGRGGQPMPRPPFPAQRGLWGKP